ncbi:YceI family protein [Rufibacter sediminis]|uniref:YceI family protein n=1 Tax=Rufibacter sediminis TaxID=2762756 RepID=A0ABR6VUM6_9BACT|nr:YceI family protein [Rufibacter sediminis]MBC3540889.1 YceI family protein [Rufibacter sediminis]
MKKRFTLQSAGLALVAGLAFASCNEAPKEGDQATITDEKAAASASGQTFVVDTAASVVQFTGNGVGKNHPGTFQMSSGTVSVANEQITGGQFTINIKSLKLKEQEEMFQTKLKPHLLSGDFFDVEKFGTATFEITKVEPYKSDGKDTSLVAGANFSVSGNFTLKGVTKNITFPARIELDDNALEAEANFNIDRRQWQMNYGNDKTLGDKFISETVNIELDLEAKRQDGAATASAQ